MIDDACVGEVVPCENKVSIQEKMLLASGFLWLHKDLHEKSIMYELRDLLLDRCDNERKSADEIFEYINNYRLNIKV